MQTVGHADTSAWPTVSTRTGNALERVWPCPCEGLPVPTTSSAGPVESSVSCDVPCGTSALESRGVRATRKSQDHGRSSISRPGTAIVATAAIAPACCRRWPSLTRAWPTEP